MRALIAGTGDLPSAIAAAAPTRPLVAAMAGFAPNGLEVDLTWRLETLGTLIANLHEHGVTEICLCGAIARPSVDLKAIDRATLPLLPTFVMALRKGDDGALRAFIDVMEKAGFAVKAAHEIAPGLLPPEGVLSTTQPYAGAEADAQQGDLVSQKQGQDDLGQACVIRDGKLLAREDDRGTDVMLAGLDGSDASGPDDLLDQMGDMLGAAADWLSNPPPRGIFYKASKPGQERRADLPLIGPDTVNAVARAGLAGLVIEAGGVMVLHQDRVRAACDAAGLFLWVRAR